MTPTQAIGLQTKQFLDSAYANQDLLKIHLVGRICLLETMVVGAVETIARLAMFTLGHVAGVFCLYQSDPVNQFLNEQTQAGFAASVLTASSLFSLLSPNLFRTVSFSGQQVQNGLRAEPQPLQNRVTPLEASALERTLVNLISNIVLLPFEMMVLCFKLPFYCIYLGFQLSVVLPIRLMLLPFEIFVRALSFERPANRFQLF